MQYDYHKVTKSKIILTPKGNKSSSMVVIFKGFNDDVLQELGAKTYLSGLAFEDYRLGRSLNAIIKLRNKEEL